MQYDINKKKKLFLNEIMNNVEVEQQKAIKIKKKLLINAKREIINETSQGPSRRLIKFEDLCIHSQILK